MCGKSINKNEFLIIFFTELPQLHFITLSSTSFLAKNKVLLIFDIRYERY